MWLLTTRFTILHGATLRSIPLLLTLPYPESNSKSDHFRLSSLFRRSFQQRVRHHSFWQGCAIMTCWQSYTYETIFAKATRLLHFFNETNIVVAFSRRLKGTDFVSFFISLSIFLFLWWWFQRNNSTYWLRQRCVCSIVMLSATNKLCYSNVP